MSVGTAAIASSVTPCRSGDFIVCREGRICGISYDGGYADHLVAPAEALARIPDALGDAEAAPLLCAGITTFNALRRSPAGAGDLVAVQGLGGLGHLAVQFASRMGFRTVALARGADKRALALELGATDYVDTAVENPRRGAASARRRRGRARDRAERRGRHGGDRGSPSRRTAALGRRACSSRFPISALSLIGSAPLHSGLAERHRQGLGGNARVRRGDGIRPRIETFPLERVADGFERMQSGKARFRAVLTMVDGAG